jgi:hypothetical protein
MKQSIRLQPLPSARLPRPPVKFAVMGNDISDDGDGVEGLVPTSEDETAPEDSVVDSTPCYYPTAPQVNSASSSPAPLNIQSPFAYRGFQE